MKNPRVFFLSVLILGGFTAQAQGQTGFTSLDCGSQEERYTDERGITYLEDGSFLEQKFSGESANVSSDFLTNNLERRLGDLRYFPKGERTCYVLEAKQGADTPYLTRASFYYGNYDAKNKAPKFDLYLGIYKWSTISFKRSNETVIKEILNYPSRDEISVCLLNTGDGTPFISALELRRLGDNTYKTDYQYLKLFNRIDFGSVNKTVVRFPDDSFDRIWNPPSSSDAIPVIGTEGDHLAKGDYKLPPLVMKTAIKPPNENVTFLRFNWSPEIKDCKFFIHIAELENVRGGREFDVIANGNQLDTIQSPERLQTPFTWPDYVKFSETNLTVMLNRTEESENPPIINAVEIFMVENVTERPTSQHEVAALRSILEFYHIDEISWQGDPCAPRFRKNWWKGVQCDLNSPTIISVNLSAYGLQGTIDSSFMNLSNVQNLDLSNNLLGGKLPAFLAEMPSLKVLNVSGNNLKGEIPRGLIEKSNNKSLIFSYDGQSGLCVPGSCEKKSSIVPIVAPIVSVAVLAVILLVFFTIWKLKKKKGEKLIPSISSNQSSKDEASPFRFKNRRFTHSDIVRTTKNFERVIGKGGFGTVYFGNLEDNTEVAIKMLSASSVQGSKEFQAEAKLLMTVHHKNLTSLIGYCDEGTNMGLVYEYMPNGNLQHLLTDKSRNVLSWEERLRIAIDAAHGLEYLHNGIKPAVIHRDVKTSNILLDEKFNAKLADFGLSKAFAIESDTGISTQICGTPGYLDPEYYISKRLTRKSDIYSFGVVLLEIITGKSAIIRGDGENSHITEWVKKAKARGGISSVVEPRLNGSYNPNSALKAVDIGLACASMDVSDRPGASDMVAELKECLKMEAAELDSKGIESAEEASGGFMSNAEYESIFLGR